jgi:hypothetical protein
MRATAPAGQAIYEGRVGWSGELGFGVRAPEVGQSATEAEGAFTEAAPAEPVGTVDTEHDANPADDDHSHAGGH